ncbi:DNA gyrase C-terminal beta-propeller domain-containing protein, partial [Streptococcus pasteurianus]
QGRVKRTPIEEYFNIRNNGLIAINLRDDDELVAVLQTSGQDNIILGSRQGYAVSFAEDDVRSMGRTATGVRGIRLDKDDYVVGAS